MGGRAEQNAEEVALFRAFLDTCPEFAGEGIKEWSIAPHDPPDIICTTACGKRIGVELSQWAHEGEFSACKSRQMIELKLLDAIGHPQPMNTSRNFWLVVFHPRAKVNITPLEYGDFRESMLRLIDNVDRDWPVENLRRPYRFRELERFPILNKWLEQVQFVPGTALVSGLDWIVPVIPTHSFDDRTMVDPLLQQLRKKAGRCAKVKTHCDEVHLVIAYDQALLYCSPIETPRRALDDVVKEAGAAFAASPSPFKRVFLFVALSPGRRVFRIV